MTAVRVGSLFSGFGGLDMAVCEVLDGETVFVSDIDPGACKILAHRYAGVPNLGDVTKVDWSPWRGCIDVLTGGFPCQDVSTAGKQAGLVHGTRSGLWHEFLRAIDELRPHMVVIENVRGLLSARGDTSEEFERAESRVAAYRNLIAWRHDREAHARSQGREDDAQRIAAGTTHRVMVAHKRAMADRRRAERRIIRAIGTVLGGLADIGYDAEWIGLPASGVGAPHGRFRVFIVAHPRGGQSARPAAAWDGLPVTPERGVCALLPTPRATDGTKGGPNQRGSSGDLMLPSAVMLLPTPAVNDMGEGKTVEAWDDWTARMQAKHGNGNGHGASLAIEAQRLLPTPGAADANDGAVVHARGNPTLIGAACGYRASDIARHGGKTPPEWGDYEPAIARWESLTRPAPAPTEIGPKGSPRLSPAFTEWMMGLPAGWITDVPGITRNEALKACGNGVVWQQAAAALRWLLTVAAAA